MPSPSNSSAPIAIVLDAYREGAFPMAKDAHDADFAFYKAKMRSLLPIEDFHVSRRLAATVRQERYNVTLDADFAAVIDGCAAPRKGRETTWINAPIRDLFTLLHAAGHAHSIECRNDDGVLVGGVYGLAIGRVFCAESMFSTARDASKVALLHLVALLRHHGFTLLDTQFLNPHLIQFGAYEISQTDYEILIGTEMRMETQLAPAPPSHLRQIALDYLARALAYRM